MSEEKIRSLTMRMLKNDKAHANRDKEQIEESNELPVAPDYLSERASEIFTEFVGRIGRMYTPSESDLDLLVLYANNKEQLESYELFLRLNGSSYDVLSFNKNGDPLVTGVRSRPEVAMLKDCKTLQFNILKEFGLSPSSRSKVSAAIVKPKKQGNKFGAVPKAAEG